MNANDAVIDLSSISVILPVNADRFLATLGIAGFVDFPDGIWMSMFIGYDVLTFVSQALLIPLNRLQESLQGSWSAIEPQRNGFTIFSMDIRKLAVDIDAKQAKCILPIEATGEQEKKRNQLASQA